MRIEETILASLLYNEQYIRKVLPFLKDEYFADASERMIFKQINQFVTEYNSRPSKDALLIGLEKLTGIEEAVYEQIVEGVNRMAEPEEVELQWLVDETETFCQDRSVYNAIMASIAILDGKDRERTKAGIPEILSDALGVSFDNHIGHDFLEDSDERFDFYHRTEEKVPFDIELLNTITNGGLSRKSLNIILAGCVHPDTLVRIRAFKDDEWVKTEVPIRIVKVLLDHYPLEVQAESGWVPITQFVDKGEHDEYILNTDQFTVRSNADHQYRTTMGWMSAEEISLLSVTIHVYTRNGLQSATCFKTEATIPIVDIQVDSKDHSYYSGGVSSHNTGVGKTLVMCHMASHNLMDGKNVLYISMEMAEERIAERIDSNLLNVNLDDLYSLHKDMYDSKLARVSKQTRGKLIIKEFPTASAHAGHIRHLLNELNLKRSFVPDIIYIDYLNICLSSRIKSGSNVNSYTYVKAIAEELRGLAVERNLPIVSATQTTRSGFSNTDPDLDDTAESFGLPATADFMFAVVTTDELYEMNQLLFKQLKNRYRDVNINKRFVVGIDRPKMRLFDLDEAEQKRIMTEPNQVKTKGDGDGPIMDNTSFGKRVNEDDLMQTLTKKAGRKDFSGLKT